MVARCVVVNRPESHSEVKQPFVSPAHCQARRYHEATAESENHQFFSGMKLCRQPA